MRLLYFIFLFVCHRLKFYNQDILTVDFLSMSKGNAEDNPIEIDSNNERLPSRSNDDESLFREDNSQHKDDTNTQSDDYQDNDRNIEQNRTTGLQQDMVDSSTSNDEEWHDPFQGSSDEAGTNSAQAQMVAVRVSIISATNEFRFTINISVIVNLIPFFNFRRQDLHQFVLGVWTMDT